MVVEMKSPANTHAMPSSPLTIKAVKAEQLFATVELSHRHPSSAAIPLLQTS